MELKDSLEQPNKPRLDNLQVDERAAEAKALMANPVFQEAMADIYSRAAGILMNAEVGSLTASAAHATMKSIRDIKQQLEDYVTDKKVRDRYHR